MTLAMTEVTKTARKAAAGGAKLGEKDFVTRLADAGEEALQRLVELPGGQKAMSAFNDLRTRVDELGKKVRGIDALEARVTKLEKELAALKKAKAPARRSTARKASS
jgi:phage shock protein A